MSGRAPDPGRRRGIFASVRDTGSHLSAGFIRSHGEEPSRFYERVLSFP